MKIILNLANKYKIKAKQFIITIFTFSVFFLRSLACRNTPTISFSISALLFFKYFFKPTKERMTIDETKKLIS